MNGNIKSFNGKEKVLKKELTKNGYHRVTLFRKKKRKHYLVHHLVAEVFIPDKTNFKSMPYEDRDSINLDDLEINHKDENKLNNNVDNLEWCTRKYNANYGTRNERVKKKLSKAIICIETGIEYESLADVTRKTGISYKHLPACCKGRLKTVGGFKWKYKEDN